MIRSLLCKIFGHKWRRLTVRERKERNVQAFGTDAIGLVLPQVRVCNRCSAERIVRLRKSTKEGK